MKHSTLHVGLSMLLLTACDSGTKAGADAKAGAAVEVKADAKASAAAGADLQAQADVKAPTAGAAVVGGSVVALKPVAEVEAALGKPIVLASADLDLAAVLRLVVEGKIRSAVELELLLNAPVTANAGASHRVDLDVDGTLDYLQVVEVRAVGAVNLELRAIASSKLDASLAVLVATIATARADGKVIVTGSYGADVKGGADFKFEKAFAAESKGDAVVVADAGAGAFVGWTLDVARPTYTSTHVSAADITVAADGAVQFGADASVRFTAEQLAALRASLKVELAALAVPDAKLEVGGKAGAGVKVKHDAKVEAGAKAGSGAKAGASAGVKVGGSGGGGKVGGSVGVSLGGGASIGGGGKAGAGIKIGGK